MKNIKGLILKIDLSKAFDKVSWLYIKIILIHLGFPPTFIRWIMCCITYVSFSVLINGSASHFFHAERGLRQGCPLSPLLFMLVMEGLSRLIYILKKGLEDYRVSRSRTNSSFLTTCSWMMCLYSSKEAFRISTLSDVLRFAQQQG